MPLRFHIHWQCNYVITESCSIEIPFDGVSVTCIVLIVVHHIPFINTSFISIFGAWVEWVNKFNLLQWLLTLSSLLKRVSHTKNVNELNTWLFAIFDIWYSVLELEWYANIKGHTVSYKHVFIPVSLENHISFCCPTTWYICLSELSLPMIQLQNVRLMPMTRKQCMIEMVGYMIMFVT